MECFKERILAAYSPRSDMFLVSYYFAPFFALSKWANNEAKARMKLKASGKITEFEFGKHYNTVENVYDFEKLDQKGYYGKFSVISLLPSRPKRNISKVMLSYFCLFFSVDPFDEGSDDDEDEDEVDEEEEGTEDEDE